MKKKLNIKWTLGLYMGLIELFANIVVLDSLYHTCTGSHK